MRDSEGVGRKECESGVDGVGGGGWRIGGTESNVRGQACTYHSLNDVLALVYAAPSIVVRVQTLLSRCTSSSKLDQWYCLHLWPHGTDGSLASGIAMKRWKKSGKMETFEWRRTTSS